MRVGFRVRVRVRVISLCNVTLTHMTAMTVAKMTTIAAIVGLSRQSSSSTTNTLPMALDKETVRVKVNKTSHGKITQDKYKDKHKHKRHDKTRHDKTSKIR